MYKPFRVYDNEEKKYVDNIYESSFGDLWSFVKGRFGIWKSALLSDYRYIKQNRIGLYDVNENPIYEGDICRTTEVLSDENGAVVCGVISYYYEYAQYLLFDYKTNKYYPLNESICKSLEIIGNVEENPELLYVEDEQENMQDNTQEEIKGQEITEEEGD